MCGWVRGVLVGWLATGCGGMVAEEGAAPGTAVESEEDLRGQPVPRAAPTPGPPSRPKVIFPPSQWNPRYAAGPESLVDFGGRLAFAANFEDDTRSLWVSDGTRAGTLALRVFPSQAPPATNTPIANLTPAGTHLFFTVSERTYGNELWVSDGTPTATGTRLVVDLTPGASGSDLWNFAAFDGAVTFFRELPATGTTPVLTELWRSEGSASNTVRLLDFGPGRSVDWRTARAGSTLIFFVRDESGATSVWGTDGTTASTRELRALTEEEGYGPLDAVSNGPRVLFTVIDAQGATSVWKTDGSTSGTVRLYTFANDGRYPRMLTTLGEYLYVGLTNPVDQRIALFRLRLDGEGGKEFVVTLSNPYASQPEAFPYLGNFSATADRIYFEQAIGSSGPAPRDTQLWVTDGTKAGTKLLHRPLSLSDEYSSPIFAVDSHLVFFAAYDAVTGIEPWVTDGTVAGTRRLKNIAPGGESSYPRYYTRVGSQVFFSAFDETQANQLWTVPTGPRP